MSQTPEEVMDEPPEEAEEYELSVGDVMTDGYVAVPADMSIEEATDQFRKFAPADPTETTIYYTYVVDDDDRLLGVASLREMLSAPDEDPISTIMTEEVVSFHESADAEQAAMDVADLHYPAVPIVDNEGRLVGIVRSDTLVDVMEAESSEDMLRMQGMSLPELKASDLTDVEEQRSRLMLDASLSDILRIRVPWLLVALVGGFMAGGVIGVYEDTLEAVVILAFFIPVVMDMGGNVGTQSSTIFIRGVVLGHIDKSNVVRRITKETIVGAVIGVMVGAVAALVAFLWIGRADIAYVVFGSMLGTSVVAALVGFLIPWLVYLIGQDPAAASNPIVTTIKDVSGLLIYFGLATLLVIELGV
ncbi:magnesium transporter MgtE [Halalkaliarchaeum desulfuricum]|uniref:Magnesium transporter MgtE n=1 Tax=Halalkaliarchaeum desulfuricum TaxID=2055893 RepID=A0A343TJE2_9EURY|nr:magnesium transporter [Halalkaliarchaeum desulfuricum]AUX09214.1 magnesium transporter MgtE [Halalkaliarchaeum desulfuricum]